MRKITLIVIHCSAVKPEQTSSAKQIDSWHKGQGWKCIGYHYATLSGYAMRVDWMRREWLRTLALRSR